ncbi:damage-control phosphatase ARMT1-like [Ylistrum balloti]|uniref:damage-control phosphatase ARMT1-like n=1 Tax=Ylistrum balloti TaxID=509963 RepID=UPI002905A92E|nr:damage-control phosphatase ARMT1-like [Ylistrum balloti]
MNRITEASPLSAKDKTSFAYLTIKDRLPVILSKIADSVYRLKGKIKESHGEEGTEDLKSLAGYIAKLRNEVQTDKPVVPIQDGRTDVSVWNDYLTEIITNTGTPPRWFESPWLYVECYMYRRVQEAAELCKTLKDFDVFRDQKEKSFFDSQQAILVLMEHLHNVVAELKSGQQVDLKHLFENFLKVSLWGNKCDLSISAGQDVAQTSSPLDQLQMFEPNILVDNSEAVLTCLQRIKVTKGHPACVDIILDNAGFELMTDLCFAEFLIASSLASKICFHVKAMPWFVSDVTTYDFNWTINQLCASNNTHMSKFANIWKQYLEDKTWQVSVDDFWTLSFPFNEMETRCPDLHARLAISDFLFLKGDLNYRKLVGDLAWPFTTPFHVSLRGFQPAPLCTLRTLKCDTVTGLRDGQADEVKAKDEKWMINGNWAVISFSDKLS